VLIQCSKDEDESSSTSISAISPDNGAVGASVTIKGKGFGINIADNLVKFNGVAAIVTSSSATEIVTTVPANATTGNVTVQVGSNTATGPAFSVTEPKVTKTYYIKFKANGTLKIFEEGNPGYQVCGQCACSYMPVLSETRNAGVDICNADNDWVIAADIVSWNKKKVLFNKNNVFPVASFGYTENGVGYYTDNVASQTGSEVNISNVVSDGDIAGKKAYKVTGTFQCKVAKSDGSSVTSITEGEFVIRYTEDF
jgi:hypothetical protein